MNSERPAATTPRAFLTAAPTTAPDVPSSLRRNRQNDAQRHAWGSAYLVTARSGRQRLVMLVVRCPGRCGQTHQFVAKPEFTSGTRSVPGCGTFTLHALYGRQVAA